MTAAWKRPGRILVLAALLCAGSIRADAGESGDTLYIYTRDYYFDPEVIRQFENATGCRVDFDYYDSVEVMYERIKAGDSGYDLIILPTVVAADLDARGQLLRINRTLIPNFRHLDTTLLLPFPDLEMRFHAPYTWSVAGIGFIRDEVDAARAASWNIFADAAFKNTAAMLNDGRFVIGAALKYLGFSLNTRNPDEIELAGEVLLEWKDSIALFGVDEPRQRLEAGELAFIQAYNGDMGSSMLANPRIGFSIPEEGSILNSDCFAILADAENPGMAHGFINHMYNPRVAARNMSTIRYYMPNRAALSLLPPELRNDPHFNIPRELLAKCEAVGDVGAAQAHYDRVWAALLTD